MCPSCFLPCRLWKVLMRFSWAALHKNLLDWPKPKIPLINCTIFFSVKWRDHYLYSLTVPVTRLPGIMGGITVSSSSLTTAQNLMIVRQWHLITQLPSCKPQVFFWPCPEIPAATSSMSLSKVFDHTIAETVTKFLKRQMNNNYKKIPLQRGADMWMLS